MKRRPGGLLRVTRWLLAIALALGQACMPRAVFIETYPSALKKGGAVRPVTVLNPDELEDAEPFATRGVLELRVMESERPDTLIGELEAEGARLGCDVLAPNGAYRMRAAVPNTMGPTWRPRLVSNGMVARQYLCGVWPSNDGEARKSRELARLAAKRLRTQGQEEEIECSADPGVGTHIRERSCPSN
jgi:hypothetical protein